jgi:hypothetical protein
VRPIKGEFDPKARCQIDVTAKVGTPNFEAVLSSTERLLVSILDRARPCGQMSARQSG